MRYWLDTESIERPCTIDLVSIGIVAEDGSEVYAESAGVVWSKASDWVIANVKPHLGDPSDRLWLPEIAKGVVDFAPPEAGPEFWGYYADYDWVVFCCLFGTMMDLPDGYPMYCRNIKQLADSLGNPHLPEQTSTEHSALADAKWTRDAHLWLESVAEGKVKL